MHHIILFVVSVCRVPVLVSEVVHHVFQPHEVHEVRVAGGGDEVHLRRGGLGRRDLEHCDKQYVKNDKENMLLVLFSV